MPVIPPRPLKAKTQLATPSTVPLLIKAILATAFLLGTVVTGVNVYGHYGFWPLAPQTDNLSEAQRQERLNAFNAVGTMHLTVVSEKDMQQALQSMQLPTPALRSFKADIEQSSAEPSAPEAAAAPQLHPLQLAWITLWDTDAEDGDVVRIDSQGYSRMVILKKQPVTFAVPVPASGIINVAGIKDGDGGGITVGLASGQVRAIFPIMSEGQNIGLRVTVE